MNLKHLDEDQLKDLNKTANKAAKALFEIMYGEFTDDELGFINDVLLGVKERSGGTVHVTFDNAALIESKNKGITVDEIVEDVFTIPVKVATGEVASRPYTDDVERKPIEEWLEENSKPWGDY